MVWRLFGWLRPAPIEREPASEPFRITTVSGVVVIDRFHHDLWRWYADMERELPILEQAVAALVEQGESRFVFDLRTAEPSSAYPITKWGGMYGVLLRFRKRFPEVPLAVLSRRIKLVAREEHLVEIRHYLPGFCETFDTLASAIEAVRDLEPFP